jgi:hypothetical protein
MSSILGTFPPLTMSPVRYLETSGKRFLSGVASYPRTVFLKLVSVEPQGSAKGCQGLRETKVHNGGRVLLAVLNLYVRIKVRVATFDTNHSVTDSNPINRCFDAEVS